MLLVVRENCGGNQNSADHWLGVGGLWAAKIFHLQYAVRNAQENSCIHGMHAARMTILDHGPSDSWNCQRKLGDAIGTWPVPMKPAPHFHSCAAHHRRRF